MAFWVYLWGIETKLAVMWQDLDYFVLSLPMRNWNSGSCLLFHGPQPGFESTYEELKLCRKTCKKNGCKSFESTYEELKPKVNEYIKYEKPTFWVYLWGIETQFYSWLQFYSWSFWVYLWGIETHQASCCCLESLLGFESTYEELKLEYPKGHF